MRTSPLIRFAFVASLLALAAPVSIAVSIAATQRPRASPHESVSATIDGAAITITYGRPYMRGRTVFGGLVQYNRVWCPGADEVTTISSSRPMQLGELRLAAGRYAMWMLPTAEAWTLIVNSDAGAFHTYHNSRTDLGHVDLQKRTLAEPVEQLTFAIDASEAHSGTVAGTPSGTSSRAGGVIRMSWETTEVSAPFAIVQ